MNAVTIVVDQNYESISSESHASAFTKRELVFSSLMANINFDYKINKKVTKIIFIETWTAVYC